MIHNQYLHCHLHSVNLLFVLCSFKPNNRIHKLSLTIVIWHRCGRPDKAREEARTFVFRRDGWGRGEGVIPIGP